MNSLQPQATGHRNVATLTKMPVSSRKKDKQILINDFVQNGKLHTSTTIFSALCKKPMSPSHPNRKKTCEKKTVSDLLAQEPGHIQWSVSATCTCFVFRLV